MRRTLTALLVAASLLAGAAFAAEPRSRNPSPIRP